jgi:hypothetical protein
MVDERHGTRDFRRERHEDDPAVGGVLPAVEVVDARRHHVLSRMGAASAVLGRQVGSFHVDPGDGRAGGARKDARAPSELREG